MSKNEAGTANVTLLEIAGNGWREVYELLPDGSRKLIYAFSNHTKKHGPNSAPSCTFTKEMSWKDFCDRFKNNPSYRSSDPL
jgi:hypothetical protein